MQEFSGLPEDMWNTWIPNELPAGMKMDRLALSVELRFPKLPV